MDHWEQCIKDAWAGVDGNAALMDHVHSSFAECIHLCIANQGQHIKHMISLNMFCNVNSNKSFSMCIFACISRLHGHTAISLLPFAFFSTVKYRLEILPYFFFNWCTELHCMDVPQFIKHSLMCEYLGSFQNFSTTNSIAMKNLCICVWFCWRCIFGIRSGKFLQLG